MAIAAVELAKLVNSATEAAKLAEEGDKAQHGRCIDILKVLQKSQVTAALLKETEAGKRVNRLSKSADANIAAAATQVVHSWKDCVKRQAQEAGPSSSQPELSSQPSFGTATNSGAANGSNKLQQREGSVSRPAAAGAAGGKPTGSARPPPKTGELCSPGMLQTVCQVCVWGA